MIRTLRILPNPKTDDEHVDEFEAKRPMVAVCSEPDSTLPGPKFCDVNFISLKTGEQVHSVGFKHPVCDVLANRRSVVITLLEKIAVFDARTLQNNITITTCYASPGPNPNPVALGTRWLAYRYTILHFVFCFLTILILFISCMCFDKSKSLNNRSLRSLQ